jgi:hypothetical protein
MDMFSSFLFFLVEKKKWKAKENFSMKYSGCSLSISFIWEVGESHDIFLTNYVDFFDKTIVIFKERCILPV